MGARPLLVIGNKNYSSWSLRPWLLLREFGIAFDERRLALDTDEFRNEIGRLSPSGRVPVLHHAGRVIWDSLAIAEYANEQFLDDRGWPQDVGLRALARSAAAEMHSGFADLRAQLPMNCDRQPAPGGRHWNEAAERDIARIRELWAQLREAGGNKGPFLCGEFGIVDAMFAPVVIRFHGYGVPLDGADAAYCDAIEGLAGLREWRAAALAEKERLAKYEQVR